MAEPLLPLPRAFYERPTLDVAQELLGHLLVRRLGDRTLCGAIVETEAYVGPEDLASHASRGLTERTRVMFGPAGHAYVYLIYGMHSCLNIVTEAEGYPAAVLIRALEPAGALDGPTNGPGRLCRTLRIDRSLNGMDLTTAGPLFIATTRYLEPASVATSTRVGVDYAGAWAARPWRFSIPGNPFVSRPHTPRRQRHQAPG